MLSCFSHVQLFVTLRTEALQAPLSVGFSRQEYWSGWPFPPLGEAQLMSELNFIYKLSS